MTIRHLRIKSTDIDVWVDYLCQKLKIDYENHSNDCTVLATEEYFFRTNSSQLNLIVLKMEKKYLLIDVIAAGGGVGIFNFSLGAEGSFCGKVYGMVEQYCEDKNLCLEEERGGKWQKA